MAHFTDLAFLITPDEPETRGFARRLAPFRSAIAAELGELAIHAPWRKLVIRVGSSSERWISPAPVGGVSQVDVPVDLAPLVELPEMEARRRGADWVRDAARQAESAGLWHDERCGPLVDRLAMVEGPLVHEPRALRVRERRAPRVEYRARYLRTEDGLTIQLACVGQDGHPAATVEVLRLDGRWDGGFDFTPRRLRLTGETIEFLDGAKRIIKSVPKAFCPG